MSDLESASGHLATAAGNMNEAAGVSQEAGQTATEGTRESASIIGELSLALSRVANLKETRSSVARYTEHGRDKASEASAHVRAAAEGIGGTALASQLGAWIHNAHQETKLGGVGELLDRIQHAGNQLTEMIGEVQGMFESEAQRQEERSGTASRMEQELEAASQAVRQVPGL